MNVRKFSEKSRIFSSKTIQWRVIDNLKYPPEQIDPITWKIFSQKNITLTPRKAINVALGLGFKSTKGVILTSLDYYIRYKECSLQNEISYGSTTNILVTIINNSNQDVTIKENELLCFVYYHY